MEINVKVRAFPNICTTLQLATEIDRPVSFIHGEKKKNLDTCYPFPPVQVNGVVKKGPVFIVKNKKYEAFKKRWNRSKKPSKGILQAKNHGKKS